MPAPALSAFAAVAITSPNCFHEHAFAYAMKWITQPLRE